MTTYCLPQNSQAVNTKYDPQGTFKESGMKYLSSLVYYKC